jgi:hypothetical protein
LLLDFAQDLHQTRAIAIVARKDGVDSGKIGHE